MRSFALELQPRRRALDCASGAPVCDRLCVPLVGRVHTRTAWHGAALINPISETGMGAAGQAMVAQASQPAVSRVSKPASAGTVLAASNCRGAADSEVGDTAGSETCATRNGGSTSEFVINTSLQRGVGEGDGVKTVSTVSTRWGKPFKRFSAPPPSHTAVNRGVNERGCESSALKRRVNDIPCVIFGRVAPKLETKSNL